MSELENKTTEAVEETESTEETVTMTREELNMLLQKEGDKRVSSALKKQEAKSQEKLREAQKVAAMSAEEKYRYELDQREAAIAAKERELILAENKNECSKILAEKGLSLELVDFCVAETAEEMSDNIKLLEKAFKASVKTEVERRLGSAIPKKNLADPDTITKEQFKHMGIAERQELATNNPELYKQLRN